jgi:ADP-ribose pyrophosphatase
MAPERKSPGKDREANELHALNSAHPPHPPHAPHPPKWNPIRRELLQDCSVFTVSREHAESPRSGEVHEFHRIDSDDWVNIVPVTAAGEVVMINQYRHGSRDIELEIPGGLIDPGEVPAEAAARELLEETGYRAASVQPIGVVNPNPALFGNRVHSFAAFDVRRVGEIQNSPSEETMVQLISRASIRDRLLSGEIRHALVVTALYWFELAHPLAGVGGSGDSK